MKRARLSLFAGVIVLGWAVSVFAYQADLINLHVPSNLQTNQLEIGFSHRFLGDVTRDQANTLLGSSAGANVGMSARFHGISMVEGLFSYATQKKEYTVGLSYQPKLTIPGLLQFEADYFSFKDPDLTSRQSNFFVLGSYLADSLSDVFVPVLNAGYDMYTECPGAGIGVMSRVTDFLCLEGEVFFPDKRNNSVANPFAVGFRLETFGHHFYLSVQNSTEIGVRRLMMGTQDNTLHLGFEIKRLMEW